MKEKKVYYRNLHSSRRKKRSISASLTIENQVSDLKQSWQGHLYKCGSLKPWRSNPHEKGHPTGLLALVKHQAFPWLTCGANPLSLDLSLFSQFSYTDAVILLVCKSNLDILRKDNFSLRGFFFVCVQCSVYCHLCFRWKSLHPGHTLAMLAVFCLWA